MSYSMIGQTHVGNKHLENQDKIISRKFQATSSHPELFLIGVADGISQCPYGGSVARYIMEQHLLVDDIFNVAGAPIDILQQYLKNLHKSFKDEFEDMYDMLNSGASLSLALAQDSGTVDCLWCGDSPIFLTKNIDGEFVTKQISIPDNDQMGALTDNFGGFADFNLKHKSLTLFSDEIITVTSDGVENANIMLNEQYENLA